MRIFTTFALTFNLLVSCLLVTYAEEKIQSYIKKFASAKNERELGSIASEINFKFGIDVLPSILEGIKSKNLKIKWGSYITATEIIATKLRAKVGGQLTNTPLEKLISNMVPKNILTTLKEIYKIAVKDAIQSPYAEIRANAIYLLGVFGGKEVVEILKKGLNDRSPRVRLLSVYSLHLLGYKEYSYFKAITGKEPKTPEEYAEYLKKRDKWGLYIKARQKIKKFGKKAIPVLVNLAKSNQEPGRCTAIDILGEMKAEEAIPIFVNYLREETREETRDETMYNVQIYCVGSLIEMDTEKSINTVFEYGLGNKNPRIRYYTAERLLEANKIEKRYPTLEKIVKEKKEEIKEVLKKLGEKGNNDMKFKVAILLVRNKEKEGIPLLIELLRDREYHGLAEDWLESITKQKFGRIPPVVSKKMLEEYIEKWERWWEENRDTFKFQ